MDLDTDINNNNLFGGIYYINLDRREDRKNEVEEEFKNIGIVAKRFPAIETKIGIIGCGLSHLTILKEARDLGLKNVLVFEDDFKFLVDKETFWNQINQFFSSDITFDVVMLSYAIMKAQPHNDLVQRIFSAQTASGYIVNQCFYDRLIDLWEESSELLISTSQHWHYANDQCWKKLQGLESNWYAFNTRLGCQRASYSDLALQFMDYGI